MAFMSAKREKIKEQQLQGFKYFKAISGMLESLHEAGCQRDRAGNRQLHMDQYMSLLLLYMFNPICTSLCGPFSRPANSKRSSGTWAVPAPPWAVCPNPHGSLTAS